MTDVRPQIDQLVSENVNRTSQKMQLVLRTELSKPTNGEETELFLRSHMVPVYGNTLPQNDFLAAVDKMINTLFTFTASGSGWILDKIIELDIKFATFNPIRDPPTFLPHQNWRHRIYCSTFATDKITIASCTALQLRGT